MPKIKLVALALLMMFLSSCMRAERGGYHAGDRPPNLIKAIDIDSIPDATPRAEALSATGNQPYTALGKNYHPLKSAHDYVVTGNASWYGEKFHGRRTASGETYDMYAMTAAHPTLPLPSYVRVTNLANNKSVVVKVNDRGPFVPNRIIDLSYVAALKLDIVADGVGQVEIRAINAGAPATSQPISPTPATEEPATETKQSPRLFIQVGAFANQNNARRLRERLTAAGFAVKHEITSPLDKVRVGPFANKNIAQEQRQRLEDLLKQKVNLVWD